MTSGINQSTVALQNNFADEPPAEPAIEVQMTRPEGLASSTIYDKIVKLSVEYGIKPDTALNIARCESSLRQYDENGQVIRGERNPDDVGVFQINEKYHLKRSQDLGFNIETTTGNIEYAMWLMKKEGTRHWNWSKPCWSKAVVLADNS